MNFNYLFEQNNPVLLAVFLLLCALSFTSWYIIFWKANRIRQERKMLADFTQRYATKPDWARAETIAEIIKQNPEGAAGSLIKEAEALRPVLAASNAADRRDILSMHLVQVLDRARVNLDKGLTLLASVGSSSPFIGLFGTVWGIYGALMKIAEAGNAGLNVVAGPMGEALVATAAGLFAAIPAVLAYNSYVRLNRLLVQDLRHIAEQMTIYLTLTKTTPGTSETSPHNAALDTLRLVRESH